MDSNFSNLCRLCAKASEDTKYLLEDDNKFLLKTLEDLVHVKINLDDGLPKRLCCNCEERVNSFIIFLEECKNAQDFLKSIQYECGPDEISVKIESVEAEDDFRQVKEELTNEFLETVIANNEDFSLVVEDNFQDDDDGEDDYIEAVALSEFKKTKRKKSKRHTSEVAVERQDLIKLAELLATPDVKCIDFFRLECHACNTEVKSWNKLEEHINATHQNEKVVPILYCFCGQPVHSKSYLYKHVAEHRNKTSGQDVDNIVSELLKFKCIYCGTAWKNWDQLKDHSRSLHNMAPVIECHCGAAIKSRSMLYKHIGNHKNPTKFPCDFCPVVKTSAMSIAKHVKKHVPQGYQCSHCLKKFTSKDLLKSHIKSHIPLEERKVHKCDICNTLYTKKSSMVNHKRIVHENIRRFVCEQCGFSCGTSGELKQHVAIHSDDKPHACTKCSKRFKTYASMKAHMDTHGDTSYQCYVCSRTLNSRRTLRKHLLVHDNECRHVCPYCNKAFKRRQSLKVHLSQHTGAKPMSCKWCDEKFMYSSTLRTHRLRFHPDKTAPQETNNDNSAIYNHTMKTTENTMANKQLDLDSVMISKIDVDDVIISI